MSQGRIDRGLSIHPHRDQTMSSQPPAAVASDEIKKWEAEQHRWWRVDVKRIDQIIPELFSTAMVAGLQDEEALGNGLEALNGIAVGISAHPVDHRTNL